MLGSGVWGRHLAEDLGLAGYARLEAPGKHARTQVVLQLCQIYPRRGRPLKPLMSARRVECVSAGAVPVHGRHQCRATAAMRLDAAAQLPSSLLGGSL